MSTQVIHRGTGATIKGGKKLDRFLKKTRVHANKSLNTAVKVEGFRLMKLLKKEIRQGAPGGKQFRPLTYISRRLDRQVKTGGGTTVRQSPNRKPLSRMAMGIKYRVDSYHPFSMKVGFVAPSGRAMDWKQGSWRQLAKKHEGGFSNQISDGLRRRILYRGGSLGRIEGGNTPFFLKRGTRQFETKPRPIVEPFWDANKRKASKNIKRNFKLKLKGKRI